MTDQVKTPPPGSPEAVQQGCKCPVMDNAHGAGIPSPQGPQYWVVFDCPLHGAK